MAIKTSSRRRIAFAILAWIIGILMFFPILWTALAAFKAEADAYAMPQTMFISPWITDNFAEVQRRSDVVTYLRNTVIIAGLSTLLGLVFAVPAAWSMAFAPKGEASGKLNGITWAGIMAAVLAVAFTILYSQGWAVTSPLLVSPCFSSYVFQPPSGCGRATPKIHCFGFSPPR